MPDSDYRDRSRSSPCSHDVFKDRMEALITSKMKEEVAQVIEERPKKPVTKA